MIPGNYRTAVKFIKCNLAIGLMFCFVDAYAQQNTPADTSGSAYTAALSKSYTTRNELFLEGLKAKTTEKKLWQYYEKRYKAIFKTLNEEIKEGQMIHIPGISASIEKSLAEIKAKNPSVPGDVKVLLVREDDPNAYTICDNTVFVHLGLFHYLESEDQVAGVLSHEIAHGLLSHTIKAMNRNFAKDKESAASAKELEDIEVKKADRAFDLLKNSIYEGGKKTRENELQADSLGYVLFKNTSYRKPAFTEALAIIERADSTRPDSLAAETYKKFFDLPKQKFEDKWMTVEDFSSYNYGSLTQRLDKDSILSHPKSKERIQYLAGIFPELQQKNTAETRISGTFNELKTVAEKERVPNLYFNERYGEALYISLLYLQKDPKDAFYRNWLGKSFQKIYEARRDYKLNKYLDKVVPKEQSKSYIQFLSFVWNLKLNEMKTIAEFYTVK